MKSCSKDSSPKEAKHGVQPWFFTVTGCELESQHPCYLILLDLSIIFPLTGMILKGQNLLNCLYLDDVNYPCPTS